MFAITHHDGTANVSVLKSGEEKYWSSLDDQFDKELRKKQLGIRREEIKQFIDLLEDSEAINKELNFDSPIDIDKDNIIMGGHSMGGMTTIETSRQDTRIKALFSFDPWLWCVLDEIQNEGYGVKQPQFHIVT